MQQMLPLAHSAYPRATRLPGNGPNYQYWVNGHHVCENPSDKPKYKQLAPPSLMATGNWLRHPCRHVGGFSATNAQSNLLRKVQFFFIYIYIHMIFKTFRKTFHNLWGQPNILFKQYVTILYYIMHIMYRYVHYSRPFLWRESAGTQQTARTRGMEDGFFLTCA